MINRLRKINEELINISIGEEKKKQLIIKEILQEEHCFDKMSIDYAYSILKDLNIDKKQIRRVYIELVKKDF